ncbi:mitochondrial inner membrane protease subunit 1 isoform X2 [Leptinotarsa decemlineata]|uniref:mitochondrial inner membrane protease subunit 1 isoform X2 n=1 Tax=Leptinotarsa decemlineata TaxID=7539 RepID=UPI000C2537AC|nr:mitochondrial inner membrane protease subunit 1-like isoform X2 [Leptinotarsa decemlineata]
MILKTCVESLGYLIKYGCLLHCTFEYVGNLVVCSGPSMEPTIHSEDILVTEHISPLKQTIRKGDIVIAKCPTNPKQYICKRVTGLPGDKIRIGFASFKTVPGGHVWLEGDNISNSSDSRVYGPVPQGLILSRAICKVWPPKEFSVLI